MMRRKSFDDELELDIPLVEEEGADQSGS